MTPAPLRITSNIEIHETKRLQAKFKDTNQLYIETVDVDKALTKQIVDVIEKKHLQEIDNTITKSITKHVLEVIQNLFENYGQVWQMTLNENTQSVKTIVYTLKEPLITVFTHIQDLIMLTKAANNPYS